MRNVPKTGRFFVFGKKKKGIFHRCRQPDGSDTKLGVIYHGKQKRLLREYTINI